jgi:DNA-3-methyladenine glycosylase II
METFQAIEHLCKDERMAVAISAVGVLPAFEAAGSLYPSLLRAVIYQQLSGKAAATIHGRFIALFDDGYPHAEQLLRLEEPVLRGVGLSRQKLGYLQNIARFFMEGHLEQQNWDDWEDEALIQHLTKIKGVGRWTVEMILMFTLNRPNVFPVDDLGIQQAMAKLYGLPEKGKALQSRMQDIAAPWQPFRTCACRYLWQWLDTGEK